jgi:hypothetical protein
VFFLSRYSIKDFTIFLEMMNYAGERGTIIVGGTKLKTSALNFYNYLLTICKN